jgi:hypothetical protein
MGAKESISITYKAVFNRDIKVPDSGRFYKKNDDHIAGMSERRMLKFLESNSTQCCYRLGCYDYFNPKEDFYIVKVTRKVIVEEEIL